MRILGLILLCFLMPTHARAADGWCPETFRLEANWRPFRPPTASNLVYHRRSEQDSRFFVKAEIDFTGALQMFFLTKIVDATGRVQRSELRAEQEFAQILEQCEGKFTRLRLAYVLPEPGEALPMGDMIEEINDQTSRGESLDAAIWASFFGRQALRHGFTKLHIDVEDGTSGHYEMVVFELRR